MAETWGIVLRDRTSGAEQWVACEVTRDDRGRHRAKSIKGDDGMSYAYDVAAVEAHARWIERTDASVAHARSVTREAYAAHMEGVRSALVADEMERMRADLDASRERANRYADALFMVGRFVGVEAYESEPIIDAIRSAVRASLTAERARADQLADTLDSIARHVDAESRDRDAIVEAIGKAYDGARREGAETMREAAARESDRYAAYCDAEGRLFGGAAHMAVLAAEHRRASEAIRALPLPPLSQPAQRPTASETPEAPSPYADAAAMARDAARGRVAP